MTRSHRSLAASSLSQSRSPFARFARRAVFGVALLGTAVAAAGCGAESSASAVQTAPSALRAGGPAANVARALDQVVLTSTQRAEAGRAVDALADALAPSRAARRDLLNTLAKGVEAGAVAHADVEKKLEQVAVADAAAVPAVQAAANRLHELLDAEQREELLEAMRDGFREDGDELGGPRERMKALAKAMDLSSDQKDALRDQMRATLGAREEGHEDDGRAELKKAFGRMHEIAKAFLSDDFDAAKLGLGADATGLRARWLELGVKLVETSLPQLSQTQRKTLGSFLRERLTSLDGDA